MLLLFTAAVLPALLLLWYVYHKDFAPEPHRLVFKGFFYGCLSTFVSTLFSSPLLAAGIITNEPGTVGEAVRLSFIGAAIPEESAKLLMLWLLLRNCPEFDERYDGLVYAAAVGLGFATFENLMYVVAAGADWVGVSISRALFAIPGHFAFAITMGYYYSQYHFPGENSNTFTKVKILLYPILLHGTYDTIVFISNLTPAIGGALTLLLIVFCMILFKGTRKKILEQAEINRYENL